MQAQYDKLKRKALLGGSKDGTLPLSNQSLNISGRQEDSARLKQGIAAFGGGNGMTGVDMGAVVGNMEAAGVRSQFHSGTNVSCDLTRPRDRFNARLSPTAQWPEGLSACSPGLRGGNPSLLILEGGRQHNVSRSARWMGRSGRV